MQWLFLLGVLVCALLFPKFRKVLLIVALLSAGVIAYFRISSYSKESASKSRINLSEVELIDVRLVSDDPNYYTIRGRVRNVSEHYTMSDFKLRVTLEDCIGEGPCNVVYQEAKSPLIEPVPPGQARNFEISSIGSYHMRLKGSLKWHYELTEVRSEE